MSQCPVLLFVFLMIAYFGSHSLFGFREVGTGRECRKNQLVMESLQQSTEFGKDFCKGAGPQVDEELKSCSIHPKLLVENRAKVGRDKRLVSETDGRVQNMPIRYDLILYPNNHHQSMNHENRDYQIRERYFATNLGSLSSSLTPLLSRFPIISIPRHPSKAPQSFHIASTVLTPHEKKNPTIFLWNFGSIQGQGLFSSSKKPSWFSVHPKKPSNLHHIPDIRTPEHYSSQPFTVPVPTYQSLPFPSAPPTVFKPQEVYPTYSAIPVVNNTFIQALSPSTAATFVTSPHKSPSEKSPDGKKQPSQPQLSFISNTSKIYYQVETIPPPVNNSIEKIFTISSDEFKSFPTQPFLKPTEPPGQSMVSVNLPLVCPAQSMVLQVQPSVTTAQSPYQQNQIQYPMPYYVQKGPVNKTLFQQLMISTGDYKGFPINQGFPSNTVNSIYIAEPNNYNKYQQPDVLLFSDNISLSFVQRPSTQPLYHHQWTPLHLKEYPKPERFFFNLTLPRH